MKKRHACVRSADCSPLFSGQLLLRAQARAAKALSVLFLLAFSITVAAADLQVANGSFESPEAYESPDVAGWHDSSAQKLVGGYVMSKAREDMPPTPHGTQWGELIGQPGAPGDLFQQIGTWRADRFCTVSLLIGNRKILPDARLAVELWAGGSQAEGNASLAAIGARRLAAVRLPLPANGKTQAVTCSLASGDDGTVGERLWLRFVQRGNLQTNAVVLIDNVTARWTDAPVESPVTATGPAVVPEPKQAYTVRDLPAPDGAVIEAGGICYWPDGTLVVGTRRGEVWTSRDGQWNRFATGLMGILGIWSDTVGVVYVTQWPELTRIRDVDGDRVADRYETVNSDWEMPGAKTDFVYGLLRDKQGNFYGSTHTNHGPWSKKAKGLPRHNFGGPMGAPVIGRGWSFRVDPQGKLTWWSSGLRAPNGLGMNAAGDLFATDNQGDWVGTSCLHHLEQGDFHGHPSSYQWDPKRTIDMTLPLDKLATELFKIRKKPAVLFPHGILGNSPSEPALAPADGSFGPFAGQFFVGDNVAPLLSRVYLEKVDGAYQGVCFPFIRGNGLKKALCRMTFSPAGKLVIGFGGRGWAPATDGLQEVTWSGETPFEMQRINCRVDGFAITFTKPLAEQDLAKAITIQSYHYTYHHKYGSPKIDVRQVPVKSIRLSTDRRVARLRIPQMTTDKIYAFKLAGVMAADGDPLANDTAYYTLNRLPAVTPPQTRSQREFFPFCMSHHDSEKRSLDEQAVLFKELGFPGCGHLSQEFGYPGFGHPKGVSVIDRAKSLEKHGLRLNLAFVRLRLDAAKPIDLEAFKAAMPTFAAHKTLVGVLLLGDRNKELDDKAVAILNQLADIAEPHGVEIAIYPHTSDYTERVDESIRVLKKLNRPDRVGVMFNLYHWMNRERDRDLRTVLTEARPWLKLVTINGSAQNKAQVLPLDQGDFDVAQVLQVLDDLDYQGPVGLMCWGIGGDARKHLSASMNKWRELTRPNQLQADKQGAVFENEVLKGRIGEGRFIGLKNVIHKPTGTLISGSGRANNHGLLTVYRVFTRNHRYGSAAYDWPERNLEVDDGAVVMRWPATKQRPFELEARYSFPGVGEIELLVTVNAHKDLSDFEVQTASYFDPAFPKAEVWVANSGKGQWVNSPRTKGHWQAFPRDPGAEAIIADGRWRQGASPVQFGIRQAYHEPRSRRQHANGKLTASLTSPDTDCFAIYTAHDGESHFSNYHALFGRTIPAGTTATARVRLMIRDNHE